MYIIIHNRANGVLVKIHPEMAPIPFSTRDYAIMVIERLWAVLAANEF